MRKLILRFLGATLGTGYPGLDQINAALPAGLKGAGVVNLSVTVDGFVSNTVTLNFK